ncbi:hypothetical protein [Leptospira noguchii]|nr:hypothetical protein [Leptospira noguchii]UOG49305.1 hypothetical protein MAL00_03100 [Leptospira noguchii]
MITKLSQKYLRIIILSKGEELVLKRFRKKRFAEFPTRLSNDAWGARR